ncbi:ATP-grasp domain-containing protein [Pseudomonas lutea]|uniref:ATP-grasp domain-containing protein n=1 Tax=Pseudomonas lutea TaxID=243924 RepID=A0ABR9AD80_9PSED|nr:ATP-grasp domain-containing protein [Pseudomonas lutea]MBD8123530.1 ATP-grasp domain-containing protein [Pseudomonas lutea]
MAAVNVLVFPCGSENASEIHQALMHSIHVNLFGASSVDDHGRFLFARYVGDLPRIDAPEFDAKFASLLAQWGIQLVFATHDSVQHYLSTRVAAWNVALVNGDTNASLTSRQKSLTYGLFSDQPWTPTVYRSVEHVQHWPVVVKPDMGQGGQGVSLVQTAAQADAASAQLEAPLLVEYLPGEEITVDCFTDRNRRIVWVGPRTRERVRAGIAMRCRPMPLSAEVETIAHLINQRLTLRGPWFFQLKKDHRGAWKLLEISCRVAGAMVTQRARGVNLPLMAVLDFMRRDVMALPLSGVNLVERRITTLAQLDEDFDTVYVDFDETVIKDGKAIPSTLYFLYRMLDKGKRLVLITRHVGDPLHALGKARIDPKLFDEIIHLDNGEKKSAFIHGRAIFVDNHFPERLDVATTCGIPVFDVDALEFFC